MIAKALFIANDGKSFENETDCMEYEFQIEYVKYKPFIHLYDRNCKELILNHDCEAYTGADIIRIDTQEAITWLEKKITEAGYDSISEITLKPNRIYYYTDRINDGWYDLQQHIEILEKFKLIFD